MGIGLLHLFRAWGVSFWFGTLSSGNFIVEEVP